MFAHLLEIALGSLVITVSKLLYISCLESNVMGAMPL